MRADYERFLKDLEQVAQKIANINVAGIEEGLSDELGKLVYSVIQLKSKARFIGGRVEDPNV